MNRRMHDDDELMFSVSEYVNKFRANRPKKEWSDMVWNKYRNAFNWGESVVTFKNGEFLLVQDVFVVAAPKSRRLADIACLLWDHFAVKVQKRARSESINSAHV